MILLLLLPGVGVGICSLRNERPYEVAISAPACIQQLLVELLLFSDIDLHQHVSLNRFDTLVGFSLAPLTVTRSLYVLAASQLLHHQALPDSSFHPQNHSTSAISPKHPRRLLQVCWTVDTASLDSLIAAPPIPAPKILLSSFPHLSSSCWSSFVFSTFLLSGATQERTRLVVRVRCVQHVGELVLMSNKTIQRLRTCGRR
eukprot:759623-Hanusia_phi.AAC.1